MKLKIFLRGLGAGISFSAIVMLVCTSTLSKEFIMDKAKEYGMVEKNVQDDMSHTQEDIDKLKDDLKTNEPKESEKPVESKKPSESTKPEESKKPTESKTAEPTRTPEVTKTAEPTKKPEATKTAEPTKKPEATKTAEPTKKPQPTKTVEPTKKPEATKTAQPTKTPVQDGEKVTFTIKRGMASYNAAKVLEECGLVESAKDFDNYLCKNKLDGYVKAGTFTATKGMSYSQLAKIITRK